MRFRYKAVLFFLLAMLIYSFSVNALSATAGLHGDVNGFWTMDKQSGTCSGVITTTGATQDEAYINETGGFACVGVGGMLFNFDNITSHLDGLVGSGQYSINNVELYSCASGSNSGSDGEIKIYWNNTGYEVPDGSLLYGTGRRFLGDGQRAYTFAEDVLVSGSVRRYNLTQSLPIMNLRIGGKTSGTTVSQTRKYLNTTACALQGDVGNKSSIYLNYTYSLNYNPVWNTTSPINNSELQITDIITINTTNITAIPEPYNISYSLDGAGFISLANLTTTTNNFTLGSGTSVGVGSHTLTVNYNGTLGSESDNLFFTVGNVVDFCTVLTNVAFNITFADEINNSAINNVSYGITLFTNNEQTTISKTGYGQSISICTTSTSTGFGANVILEYNNATGSFYQARTYFNYFNFSGTAQTNITAYLLESALSTLVDATLQDEDALPLVKKYIQMHRYNAGTNTYRVVDSGLSDENGVSPLSLDLNEVLYKIVILDFEGNILDTTLTKEITGNFILTILGSLEKTNEILNQLINSLDFSLTYVNATKIITLTWEDTLTTLTSQQCLKVTNRSLSGLETVSNNCVNTPYGTLTYNYTTNTGADLLASFYATSTIDSNEYEVYNIVIINLNNFVNYRGNEFIFAILIIGTLAGLGALMGSIGILVLTTLGIFITYMLGMFAISAVTLWGLVFVILFAIAMGGRTR